jgi:hypothetical protein
MTNPSIALPCRIFLAAGRLYPAADGSLMLQ